MRVRAYLTWDTVYVCCPFILYMMVLLRVIKVTSRNLLRDVLDGLRATIFPDKFVSVLILRVVVYFAVNFRDVCA